MALKSYILTADFKSPYVVMTGNPRNPQKVMAKQFIKGEIVDCELKHANNKPAFLLFKGTCVIPLTHAKELVAKDVKEENSNADGKSKDDSSEKSFEMESKISISKNPKVQYLDAVVLGGLIGFGATYMAQKKGWLVTMEKHANFYGAGLGAALGLYLVYRHKNK